MHDKSRCRQWIQLYIEHNQSINKYVTTGVPVETN